MKLMNPDLTLAQTNAMFQRIDQDSNQSISFIEFLAATLDPSEVDASELKQVRNIKLKDGGRVTVPSAIDTTADMYYILYFLGLPTD